MTTTAEGKITQIIGAVIDVQFPRESIPHVYEALKLKDVPTLQAPDCRQHVTESCQKLGLDFNTATLFEWLEADDEASFHHQMAAR